ncbi:MULTISPECIES: chalcone isomerase family protein [Comamonas]|uniref:chalcone isomerase family protein n=1 Tax=Comamonas TaxID=283 RepID=UPI002112564D|nr:MULTISPECIES: chalcone isomerase family protein [Comamonas]UUC91641.1 chalcone isomerase family protein [Comamonas sp. C11]WEE75546.1 chalcone isomerase family protein [Comamonas testosteroni]
MTAPPLRPHRRQALAWGAALALAPSLTTMSNALHAKTPAADLPTELRSALPAARLMGTGVLRFFGLRVYEARLWAAPGSLPDDYALHPFALELVYDRKLEGAAIAERSIAEMRRVGSFTDEQARRWLALMKQAFPDVVAQDRLLGLNDGQGEVRFFHNGRQTAQLRDADYARLFFGIWLAPQTSAPAMRSSLLGLG